MKMLLVHSAKNINGQLIFKYQRKRHDCDIISTVQYTVLIHGTTFDPNKSGLKQSGHGEKKRILH